MRVQFDKGPYVFIPSNIASEHQLAEYIRSTFSQSLPETTTSLIKLVYPEALKTKGLYSDVTGRIAAISGEALLNCPSYWLVQAFPPGHAYHYEWQSTSRSSSP